MGPSGFETRGPASPARTFTWSPESETSRVQGSLCQGGEGLCLQDGAQEQRTSTLIHFQLPCPDCSRHPTPPKGWPTPHCFCTSSQGLEYRESH